MLNLSKYVSKKIRNNKIKKEGGVLYSRTLRDFTEKSYGVSVDLYTYGSCFEKGFNLGGKVKIGRYCSIASDVRYFGANHPMENITTSAVFYNQKLSHLPVSDVERHTLTVGNDVWIGAKVLITSSCSRIGDGAVIGAGSVVTHDVEPYSIVAGNPARVIRKRFSDEKIKEILLSKWWENTPQDLMKLYPLMSDVDSFCERLKKASTPKFRISVNGK
jgi:acetyltransferase-like isoleucine patch superfamily enzyme